MPFYMEKEPPPPEKDMTPVDVDGTTVFVYIYYCGFYVKINGEYFSITAESLYHYNLPIKERNGLIIYLSSVKMSDKNKEITKKAIEKFTLRDGSKRFFEYG